MIKIKAPNNRWLSGGFLVIAVGLTIAMALPSNFSASSNSVVVADASGEITVAQAPVGPADLPIVENPVGAKLGAPGTEEKIQQFKDQAAQIAAREQARIETARNKKIAERRAIRAKYTVNPARARISVPYGRRGRIWDLGWHTGTDFNGNYGDPVYSARVGTVLFTGWRPAYGRTIEIRQLDGSVTRYAHLSQIRVEPGQDVDVGQRIGNIGASGKAFGAHLHFEVMVNGQFRNPWIWLWGKD
jgi:murein DD-endopeptidase MepM/ murein hydrolase activator NlpD